MGRMGNLTIPPGNKAQTVVDERIRDLKYGHSYLYLAVYELAPGKTKEILIHRPGGNYKVKFLSSSKANGPCRFNVLAIPTVTDLGEEVSEPWPFNRQIGGHPPNLKLYDGPEYTGGLLIGEQMVQHGLSALSDSWEDRAIEASGLEPGNGILKWKNEHTTDIFVNFAFAWCEHDV
jgi:hypothetical protein